MPLISLRTSLASIDRRDELLLELSAMLARETGKPEDYVMTLLETDVPMTFGGSSAPAALGISISWMSNQPKVFPFQPKQFAGISTKQM